jgi:hypothetical protein
MFQRQIDLETCRCPNCGSKLTSELDLFLCEKHGSFFIYGSRLLVHVSLQSIVLAKPLLPWENQDTQRMT